MAWHIPTDFKYFKKQTKGHPIIMGRKTFESIGRPLPGRLSIVLTRQNDLDLPEGVFVTSSIDEAIKIASDSNEYDTSKIFIIGGAQIYKASLEKTEIFYITEVDTEIQNGDAFYPELPENLELVSSEDAFDKFDLKFKVYRRV
jgi:dihydrofolate reductase